MVPNQLIALRLLIYFGVLIYLEFENLVDKILIYAW